MRRQRQRHFSTSSVILTPTLIPTAPPSPFVYPPLPQPTSPEGGEGRGGGVGRFFLPGLPPRAARPKSLPSGSLAVASASLPVTCTSTLEARKRRSSRDLQVVRTLVCLVLLFLLMWAPIFIVFVLIMRDAHYDVMQVSSQAFLGAMCVAYSNAVLNPLAYGLSTDRLRFYLRNCFRSSVLGRCCCCCYPSSALANRLTSGPGLGEGGGGRGAEEDRRVRLVGEVEGAGTMVKSSGGTSVS